MGTRQVKGVCTRQVKGVQGNFEAGTRGARQVQHRSKGCEAGMRQVKWVQGR